MKKLLIFLLTLGTALFSSFSFATVIHVPGDYPTIQAGIDVAIPGDTVLVADGTYTGNGNRDIDFGGKGIVLKSENGSDFTIIDCQGDSLDPHRGFNFHSGEDSTAVVDGFTIQGGYGLYDDPDGYSVGGGIKCDSSSSPSLINNTISGNFTHYYGSGGGIYCSFSSPTISNNTITGNSRSHYGGGIFCSNSSPTISNNTISGNSVIGPWGHSYGGGIYCSNYSNPTISNNTISGNSAYGYGGGICCASSSPTISNNTISGNSTDYGGGGIHCYDSSPIITNTIFWANTGPQIYVGSGSPIITYCDIAGGWEGEGNIDSNPLFFDPYNGNYNVCSQSPCINAGDPDMTDPDGTRSDIGVFYPEHPECFFGNVWHVSTTGNDTTGDGSPGNPFRTIQHAINVSLYGDTVIVQNGTYVENIHINLKNIVLASNYMYSGDTLDIQNTIIDGDSVSTVVTFEFCDSLTAITGFTIRNGSGVYGGGIYCWFSSPTISSNTISGNSANRGGGIYCHGSSPTISSNTISGNSATSGGGISCTQNSNPTISNNTISGNSASYSGGGIWCIPSNPTIINNTISGNSAQYGGGIYCGGSSPTITSNTISGNSAGDGGGIYCEYDSDPTLENCIIAFSIGSEAVYCSDGSSNPTLTCCDVYGNAGGDWVGCIADQDTIPGNISCDPLFCYPDTGNYYLYDSSCCVGAGCDSLGNPDSTVDIGAFGVGCSFVCGDLNNDTEVDLQDVVYLITYLYLNGPPPECEPLTLCAEVNLNGVVDIGDVVYLINYVYRNGPPPCNP